ncbi:uncharacterized protein LOC101852419 [Aplysia californica]|uniref:Uncharacterized protein LOC101852419 n=1 Tax=Aplysia californica TaxID=6500 RepID=A0ABM0JUL3_APLCA|nr:uncharacterized protein LOC101852419 [Aplysia californica]
MAVIPRQNAENLTGPQFRPWVDVRMPSLPPGQVQLVSVRGDNYNADEMTLSFRCPPEMERNGTLRGFVVRVMVLSVQDNTTPQLQGEFFIPLGKHHREPCSYKVDAADLNGIEVLKNYSFEVKVRGEEFDGAYTDPVFFFASEKIPILDRAIPGREVLVPVRSFGGAMDIKLCALCAVNERQGPVQEVGLLICVRDSDDGGCSYPDATGIKNLSDINATTWARSRAVGFAIPFWASPDNWLEKLLKDPSTDYLYTIGADKDCDTNTVSTFCNGPLPLNKVFTISLFTCNGAGCDEYNTYYTDRFNTKDQDDVGDDDGLTDGHITAIAVGVIVLSVAVVVVIIFIVRKMRGRSFPT